MILKEQDPLFEKHRVNTKPINYAILANDYYKRFVRQSDLYSEHAYWKATSVPALDPSHSSTTVIVEVPKELPKVFTMKMEILLEPTSNKLMVEHAEYDESNTYVLERFNTSAGNPVKKILLKLNLSDHRLCKMVVECQSVKVKEFQERCNIKAFQEWYEHVGPEVASPQVGNVTRWRRDCTWLMISRCSRSQCQVQVQGTSSIQEVYDHYNIFTRESQEDELKTKDKA
ncbi:hypothetical protein Tco_1133843 [Tanacetum coccineum]